MILKSDEIVRRLGRDLTITPLTNLAKIRESGSSSIDLRLGRWFLSMKLNQISELTLREPKTPPEEDPIHRLARENFIRFGGKFVLHPGSFVLGSTLEWIKLPPDLSGLVLGKSGWGRRGLIIETSPGVHPGFCGCLTLELTNVGEVPIAVEPGVEICQLYLQTTRGGKSKASSKFSCRRKPAFSSIEVDDVLLRLKSKTDLTAPNSGEVIRGES